MASAVLQEELSCSICRELYTEPVTLRCGHSFCLTCINKSWDSQGLREEEYSCPECRDTSLMRPAVKRNMRLCNIVKCFHPNRTKKQFTGIICTYCISSLVPAVKSCLLCEASLCDTHLEVHNKSEEHVLSKPTTSFENKKCSLHKKLLEYYCSEDGACICMSCCISKEHQGHQVEPINDACKKRVQKLHNLLSKLVPEQEMTDTKIKELKQHKDHKSVAEQATGIFRDIREQQTALENIILNAIPKQEEKVTLAFSDQMRKLELRKDELSRKIGHIEELCNTDDPIKVLKESQRDELNSAEERRDDSLADDMDHILISQSLLTALIDIVMDVKGKTEFCVQKASDLLLDAKVAALANTKHTSGSTSKKLKEQSTPAKEQHQNAGSPKSVESKTVLRVRTNTHNIHSDTVLPWQHFQQVSAIALDEGTAATNVKLKYKNSFITWSEIQLREETPERFESGQVLSSTSFSSGLHHWDVETSESGYWRVGVAYACIERKGHTFCIGENKESWCLSMLCGNYSALHEGKEKDLSRLDIKGNIFRITVDYEAGLLSFSQLKDKMRTIHTFSARFTEPLHAAFWVSSGAWVRISSL
ncbi:E3 ubiquitin/ISG15 ligase TRIM25 [Xenopus laevis]|uniref:Uncharacterized protein n=2 Tax=Xenopus laevis TaxID=8355 RepID=A0A974BYM1_XENLA|nr:E3 ubiquitin/ISG15 ligase TRIM25 [Xenopus laevis]OCT63126.1 hypothetical protein XELAEV_18044223mg [Xenopus laevis]